MSKFKTNQVILIKVESTYDSDPTPTEGSDAVVVEDFQWSFEDTKIAERNIATGSLRKGPKQYAGALLGLSFKCALKGSGTIDVPPDFGVALRACGFLQTINASTSVVYTVDSTDKKSVTCYFDDDGDLWKVTGLRGNVKFTHEAGAFAYAEFQLKGKLAQEPAAHGGFSPTYQTTEPLPLLGKPLTIGGQTLEQQSFDIDMQNQVVSPAILNNAHGFGQVRISGRDPVLGIKLFPGAAASFDPVSDFTSNTTRTPTFPLVGSSAGERWQWTFGGDARYNAAPSPGDEDGLVSYDLTADLLESALGADDELTLTFT